MQATKQIIAEVEQEVIEWGYGWKFLTPFGTTENDSYGSFEYNLPQRGQKWSNWTEHPEPLAEMDRGSDCGKGRLHIMNKIDAGYANKTHAWWLWYVRYEKRDLVGSSAQKVGVRKLQLRRVQPKTFHRMIKFGWCRNANLSGANLSGANLSGANLSGANLYGANLSGARNLKESRYLKDALNLDKAIGYTPEPETDTKDEDEESDSDDSDDD